MTEYKKEIKSKILKTAMEQFMTHGIKNVKMDDIARLLAISKRTLYEIYQNKEQLLYEGICETEEYFNNYLHQYAKEDNHNAVEVLLQLYYIQIESFSRINSTFFNDIFKYDKVCKMLSNHRKNRSDQAHEFFLKGIEDGLFRKEINFDIISAIFQNTMNYIMESQMYNRFSFKNIFENTYLTYIRGICTEKGVRIVDEKLREKI